MQKIDEKKLASIFDSQNDAIFQDKIWERCSSVNQNDDEVIELKFDCFRYSHSQKKLKAVTLWLGEQTLYHIKKDKPHGMLSLTFATLTTLQIEGEEAIRLEKNKQMVDLIVKNPEQLRQLLQKKCILRTFHSDYKVQKQIGKGSFANVYLATHKQSGMPFAVKAFNKVQILREMKGKESLKNEIKIMRTLNQENLLHLHEVHETENSVYFILDLLEGGELLQKIPNTIFSAKALQQLMYKLLKALQYMHQKNCMHRDLKPQNILLKSQLNDTDIVLADFGLAMFMKDEPLFKRCGTPGFVAPEILKYESDFEFYDEKCDIFSAGAIFYMLLTGNCPFYGENGTQILQMNKQCQINFEIKAFEKAPKELKHLMKKMLKINPNDRYSADQCLHHPYFQEIFDSQNLLEFRENKKQQFLINGIQQINHDSKRGSLELITKETPWNGKIETIESFASVSNGNSPNQNEKKQTQLSRFGKFSQDLAEFYANSQSLNKNSKKESLHKTAMRNAQRNKGQCKDDDYIPEESISELDKNVQSLKRQMPKGGYYQKSNTCDFQY